MKALWRIMYKQIFSLLTCLVLALTFMCANPIKVNAADQVVSLSLNSRNREENVPFRIANMFPGDSITQYYKLSVSYTGTLAIHFQASIEGDAKVLAEVLEVKVRLVNTGELLYEGILADMPMLEHELSTDSKSLTEDLTYKITFGLSTSVGSEYQNKSMTVDLSWWAEGEQASEGGDKPAEPGEPEDEDQQTGSDDDKSGSLINPPLTGDGSQILIWLMFLCVAIVAILLVVVEYRKNRQVTMAFDVSGDSQFAVVHSCRRFFSGIALVIFLILALSITTFALVWQKVTVEENLFITGNVSLSLNDDQPVFREDILFEPGMVIKKDFTLRNDSTCDVLYRLYFTNVEGEFARVLQVEVLNGEAVLFEGTMADINGEKSEGADGILREGEERVMTIVFRVPEDCDNVMQGNTILFDLNADAVQAVNNPDSLFE